MFVLEPQPAAAVLSGWRGDRRVPRCASARRPGMARKTGSPRPRPRLRRAAGGAEAGCRTAASLAARPFAQQPEWFLGQGTSRPTARTPVCWSSCSTAAQRLPVHCHPEPEPTAGPIWATLHGKTEAWIVLRTGTADACVYLGFRDDIPASVLCATSRCYQDVPALVGALRRVPVALGDSVLVPHGYTACHQGPGVFLAGTLWSPPTCPSCWNGPGSWPTAANSAVSAWATPACWRRWTAPGGTPTGWPACASGPPHAARGGGVTRLLP